MSMGTEFQAFVSHLSSPVPQVGEILSVHMYESFCHILNTSNLLHFNYTVLWQVHYKNNQEVSTENFFMEVKSI